MKPKIIIGLLLMLILCPFAYASGEKIIFLHHSTGLAIIDEGSVREGLTALGYQFYDHGYNEEGLRDASGEWTGQNFNVPGDNTDPDGYADIFSQGSHSPPDNTLSHLLLYDIIVFKSCFPTSVITSGEMLSDYKGYYLTIRNTIDRYPDKLFVIVTMPPELPGNTDPAAAQRARDFTQWLQSDEYLGDRQNVVVFDLFNQLADGSNVLKSTFRRDEYDAHPNNLANREIGPKFVRFLDEAIKAADLPGSPSTTPAYTTPTPEHEPEYADQPTLVDTPERSSASGIIDDFESHRYIWEDHNEMEGSEFSCKTESGTVNSGTGALHIDYDIINGGHADCGTHFEAQDWSGYDGVDVYVRSNNQGQFYKFLFFSSINGENVPYEVEMMTSDASTRGFSKVFLPWNVFSRSDWSDGPKTPDLKSIVGLDFNFEARGADQHGQIWVDDIALGKEYELVVEAPPRTDYAKRTDDPIVADQNQKDNLGITLLYVGIGILLLAAILFLVWWLVRRR